ncbi:hypothetical protein X878_0072 [Enterococcus phage VD13]|uniref:Uncharacterized protein n=1 Tax=Enterococcus phage VD13 TaxID=1458851 RepID=X2KM96_9CAUD|nr:hypothetical protein X878_0072 [Enterococcus phage VD13]YP_009592514.1 hypothetical protein FDG77_gp73 [Enterococcus phage VD13]AHL19658.1 hypothetical protein VD13_073 [Enterococcus phage VD13]AHN83160.1 hypothetical protein X878_0072 [Enterococcus phage VD13]
MEFNEAKLYYLLALLKDDINELKELFVRNEELGAGANTLHHINEYILLNLKIRTSLLLKLEKLQEGFPYAY